MTTAETVSALTQEEKQFAITYLVSTRDDLRGAVRNMSPAQASFRRNPNEWCIADIVEHLAIIEGRVQMLVARLPEAPPSGEDRNDAEIDAFIPQALPLRTSRVQAPDAVQPKGQCTLSESTDQFVRAREDTVLLLESAPCLRGRVLPHPVFGPWDGYQWILAAAAHTARHLNQIREIKCSPAFPDR